MKPRILLVDDDQEMVETTSLGLRKFADVDGATSAKTAIDKMANSEFDVVITDLHMPGMNGIDLCAELVAVRPDVPVIVITAFGSLESAVSAIRAGAYDYVTKPFQTETLAHAVRRAAQHRALREEVKRLKRDVQRNAGVDEVWGESEPIRRLRDLMAHVADSDASVLITGESGTGKEVVARALHRAGRRKDGPFIALNCAAVPEALLESELFGHARGAFTDAKTARTGLFAEADGGVLFLDEVGDTPFSLQPKLLRALQDRKIRPIGGTTEVSFDARIIAATNKDLDQAVAEGRFREDLFYRLNVIEVSLPPLRTRGNDVLLLAQRFVERFAAQSHKRVLGISPRVAEQLLAYAWPGNVRELSNCIERAVALARFEEITVDDLPERVRSPSKVRAAGIDEAPIDVPTLDELERRHILRVLSLVEGNKSLASQMLGVDRKTLYRKLDRYNGHN
ncbi:MAG: sigma-54-dependent Fis family transcriptional regulator [Polyangiaceae bacterium]|nr:sigma-54-dependent Fis family transcriptional regulator [Polyangiaceae bacterium]